MSSALFFAVFHTYNGDPIAEGTMKRNFIGLLVTLAACNPFSIRVQDEEPATEFEKLLTVVLKVSQTHDVMLDIAAGTFEGERFQRHDPGIKYQLIFHI